MLVDDATATLLDNTGSKSDDTDLVKPVLVSSTPGMNCVCIYVCVCEYNLCLFKGSFFKNVFFFFFYLLNILWNLEKINLFHK